MADFFEVVSSINFAGLYPIVSAIVFGWLALIWTRSNNFNLLIKVVLIGMTFWSLYSAGFIIKV